MTALVDADSIIYRVGFAIEDKVIWNEAEAEAGLEEPEIEYYTDLNACFRTIDQHIENILFATEADDVFLVFTGKNNFRENNPLGYKEHRKELRKPEGFDEIKKYIQGKYHSKICDGYEADDYVVYEYLNSNKDYVLCAIDKDVLYQTPGTHYNYITDDYVVVTEVEALRFGYYQCLVGDVSDGYKGCPGIGKVKASKILEELTTEKEMWLAVVAAYEEKGLTIDDAINTMRLASMHQLTAKGVVLWDPPK